MDGLWSAAANLGFDALFFQTRENVPGGGRERNLRLRLEAGAARFVWSLRSQGARDHDRLMLRLLDRDFHAAWVAAANARDEAWLEALLRPPPDGLARRRYLAGMAAANRRLARWAEAQPP